jgi:succinoglycan biosynthesis transport protein ExoP
MHKPPYSRLPPPQPAGGVQSNAPPSAPPLAQDQFHSFFQQAPTAPAAAEPQQYGHGRPGWTRPPEEALDVAKYAMALRRRWAVLLACCLLALIFSAVRYALTEKVYKATATIQIERKRLSLLALGQAGWLEDWWNLEYYPTQYRLLRSRGMAERVVLNLHEDPSFNPRAAQLVTSGGRPSADSSSELAQLAARVMGGLTVNPITETQLVELSYQSTSPDLASRIANGYADVFIEWGIENRTYTVGQASSFLSAQIETLRQEIEERQKQLNSFTSKSGFTLDPAGEALVQRRQTLEQQYNTVVAERISKEAALSSAGAGADTSGDMRGNELRSDLIRLEGEYQKKLETFTPEWPEMKELQREIAEKRDQLKRMGAATRQDAAERARADYQRAKREEESLELELRKLAADARLQNGSVLEYANQTTYIDTRKQLLAELVKRQSETEVASRVQTSQESNVRVVDRAIVPGKPFKPSLQGDMSQSLIAGLLLGIGAIFLLEYLDRSVKDPEELESILGLPTLAVIPDIDDKARSGGMRFRYGKSYSYQYGYGYGYGYGSGSKDGNSQESSTDVARPAERQIELLPHHSPRLAVSEAYRSLRTALLLSTAGELHIVALTSAEPGEGKTATTTNLGVVMAQLGRRVLLIDADLRRPRMHKVFRISNRVGLVTFLTAHVDDSTLFTETSVPNLWVCPSGPIPPNPSELLASGRMVEFLDLVRQRFDFVLIDTPPTLPVADAVIVGTMVDGVIVCARAGVVTREDARFCRDKLAYADLRVIGSVLNRYRTAPGRYNKKYRYYGVYEEKQEPKSSAA